VSPETAPAIPSASHGAPAAQPIEPLRHWLPFEWIVAIRFLREGRVQSTFIIGGVAIGVAVIVFMSALMTGAQANMIRRTLTGQAHIQLSQPKETTQPLSEGVTGLREGAIVQAPF